MKKSILTATLALIFAAVQPTLHAQAVDASAIPPPNKVVDLLATRLALSDAQKQQIAPILADRQQKVRAILADTSSRPFQKKREATKVRDESDKQIKAILTPDQFKQYTALEAQMQEQMKEKRQEKSATPN